MTGRASLVKRGSCYFRAKPRGVQAVRETLERIETMKDGLAAVLRK